MSKMPNQLHTKVCIVGGGPAGMITGFLLARKGIQVTVIEKHKDFFRDFRGDTIHPSTMQLLQELGLLQKFLKLPHQKSETLKGYVNGEEIELVNFKNLNVPAPYVAFMPQWDFLNFISKEAKKYPSFTLEMETEATDTIEEGGTVTGVKAKSKGKKIDIHADLVIAADGRDSTIRQKAHLKVISDKVPIDVLWFRIPRKATDPSFSLGYIKAGKFMVMIERDTYWQCGYVIEKGKFDEMKKKNIKEFEKDLQDLLDTDEELLKDMTWSDIKLLSVTVDYLKKWYKPGLLCIGDAAHAMSPVAGVGINLAIQDAVAAARILSPPLKDGKVNESDLKKVQERRQFPTRVIQRVQLFLHNRVVLPTLKASKLTKPALPFRLIQKIPILKRIPSRLIGIGIRPEHVDK